MRQYQLPRQNHRWASLYRLLSLALCLPLIYVAGYSQTPEAPPSHQLPPLNNNATSTGSSPAVPKEAGKDLESQTRPSAESTANTPAPATNIPAEDTPEFTAFLEQRLTLNSVPVNVSMPEKFVVQAMMRILVNKRIYPQAVYNLYTKNINPLVSKAALANTIVKSQGYDLSLYSEYPVYRDVPKSHWAYAPIEVARERKLIQGDKQGYFHPQTIVTRQDAYLLLSSMLAGARPTLELSDKILAPFSDTKNIPAEIRPDIARLVNAQIILKQPEPNNKINLQEKLDFAELAGIISREVEILDYKRLLLPVEEEVLPQIPPGLMFAVVPNSALFKNRLVVGDPLYFSLTEPVQATIAGATVEIPRGSRLDGELANIVNSGDMQVSATPTPAKKSSKPSTASPSAPVEKVSGQAYVVHFEKVQLPGGKYYQLHGNISLLFNDADDEPFIVPGTPFQFTTTTK